MPYAFVQDVPITMEIYDRIRADPGAAPPPGLVVHLAVQTAQGLRYIDVWDSEADCERFTEERLHPVVGRVLAEAGFPRPAEEPPRQPLDVRDVWQP